VRLVWSKERSASFDGDFYSLKGYRPGPHPAHDIGIWVGAAGPRMLALIGRLADGWVPSLFWAPPERLPGLHKRIDEPPRPGVSQRRSGASITSTAG
jgi:alkanesulfonate monooxygenase SsuD/methylene tetrahydromethanopterin reductase-like flavin-dependent oxidoreductase (luciferase family)